MDLRRFFVESNQIQENFITIKGGEFIHIKKVLRYKVGYKLIVFANNGYEYYCSIKEMLNDYAILSIENKIRVDSKNIELTLYAGLLKNHKLDMTLQKAVELGVDKFIPFTSKNTNESKFNLVRANKIALESAKQCGSVFLTKVSNVVSFDEMLTKFNQYDMVLFAYEKEKFNSIKNIEFKGNRIALIVGSEGGFCEDEKIKALNNGAEIITLGKRILRAETAGIVATALTLDALGELDNEKL